MTENEYKKRWKKMLAVPISKRNFYDSGPSQCVGCNRKRILISRANCMDCYVEWIERGIDFSHERNPVDRPKLSKESLLRIATADKYEDL